ncbi:MAG: hypothetical protein K0R23_3035 [Lacrimispora sp.]|jgi:hypothetical protein|nr:hypothetical protein [Lacrimispora sp.]
MMEQAMLNGRMLTGGAGNREPYNTQLLYFTSSSVSENDERIYMICDKGGSPNVMVKDLLTGEERFLTDNQKGILKSYVYFDGTFNQGLGKASVCLDSKRDAVYFIQNDKICKADLTGTVTVLNTVPSGRMTAFTHVSADGTYLCVPMTDGRCLDFDPVTEGSGLDRRPVYDIDGRIQEENLNSYLCVYNTHTGDMLYEKVVEKCWITHVQFHPQNPELIMYNHEWASFDCGIRRIWLYDHSQDTLTPVRREGSDTLGNPGGCFRSKHDWVCHEMWSDDGANIIYHGGFVGGPAMVGKYELGTGKYWEIALPDSYDAYGHFTMDHAGNLVCDGYFKYPWEVKKIRENSTDNGPDPHKKDAEYICRVFVDWERGELKWVPLCRHESDWLGQDAHPHPIYSHTGDRIFFNSRWNQNVNVYCVSSMEPFNG